MKSQIMYIAGKITGDVNYRQKFQKAQAQMQSKGYIVITPSVLPEGMGPADYMRICFSMMETADVVAFLPDWHESKGAQLELQWCEYVNKPVVMLDGEDGGESDGFRTDGN